MANTSSDSDLDTGNLMLVLSPADFTDLARAVNAAGTVGALSPQRAEAVCRLLAAAQPAGPRYLLVTREICCDGRDALEFEQHETRDGLNAAVLKHALEYRDDIWAFDRGVEIDNPARLPEVVTAIGAARAEQQAARDAAHIEHRRVEYLRLRAEFEPSLPTSKDAS